MEKHQMVATRTLGLGVAVVVGVLTLDVAGPFPFGATANALTKFSQQALSSRTASSGKTGTSSTKNTKTAKTGSKNAWSNSAYCKSNPKYGRGCSTSGNSTANSGTTGGQNGTNGTTSGNKLSPFDKYENCRNNPAVAGCGKVIAKFDASLHAAFCQTNPAACGNQTGAGGNPGNSSNTGTQTGTGGNPGNSGNTGTQPGTGGNPGNSSNTGTQTGTGGNPGNSGKTGTRTGTGGTTPGNPPPATTNAGNPTRLATGPGSALPRTTTQTNQPGNAPGGHGFSLVRLGNASFPVVAGPKRIWRDGGWKSFVPFAALDVVAVGGAYYYPSAYVSVGRSYCSGLTPEGCHLNWQMVAFEDSGGAFQCVQFCPREGQPVPQHVVALTPPPPPAGTRCEITIFAEPGFGGASSQATADEPSLGEAGWKDQISSVQVKAGIWDFFGDDRFQSENMRLLPGQYPQLGPDFTKRIGSFMCVQGTS
jgi:hypothetical protein